MIPGKKYKYKHNNHNYECLCAAPPRKDGTITVWLQAVSYKSESFEFAVTPAHRLWEEQ